MSSISQRPWSFAMSARPLICDREYPEPSGLFGSIARSIFVAGGVGLSAGAGGGEDGLREVSASIAWAPVMAARVGVWWEAGGVASASSPRLRRGRGPVYF